MNIPGTGKCLIDVTYLLFYFYWITCVRDLESKGMVWSKQVGFVQRFSTCVLKSCCWAATWLQRKKKLCEWWSEVITLAWSRKSQWLPSLLGFCIKCQQNIHAIKRNNLKQLIVGRASDFKSLYYLSSNLSRNLVKYWKIFL